MVSRGKGSCCWGSHRRFSGAFWLDLLVVEKIHYSRSTRIIPETKTFYPTSEVSNLLFS